MMTCRSCRNALPAFLAGELTTGSAGAIRSHLQHCMECRREAARWQQARKGLLAASNGNDHLGEAWFAAMQRDIVARVASEPLPLAMPWPAGRGPAQMRRWWPLLALAAAMLLWGWFWLPGWMGMAPAPRLPAPVAFATPVAVGERWLDRASLALPSTRSGKAEAAGAVWGEAGPKWPPLLLLGSESSQIGAGLQHRFRLQRLVTTATAADAPARPGLPVQRLPRSDPR